MEILMFWTKYTEEDNHILQPFALNNKIAFCKTLKEKRMLVSSLPSIHIHSR